MEIDSNNCGSVEEVQEVSNPASHIVNHEVDNNTVRVLLVSRSKTQRLVTLSIPDENCTMLDLIIKMDIARNRHLKIYLVKDKSVDLNYVVRDSKPGNYSNSDQGCNQENENRGFSSHVSSQFEGSNYLKKRHEQFYSNDIKDNQSLKSEENESKAYKRDREQHYRHQFTANTNLIDEPGTSTDSSDDEIFPTHNLRKSNFSALKVRNAKENAKLKLMPIQELDSTCDFISNGSDHEFGHNIDVADGCVESQIENMADDSIQAPCVTLVCKIVIIGSYHYIPNEAVIISPKGMDMQVPLPNNNTTIVSLNIEFKHLLRVLFHSGETIPTLIFWAASKAGHVVREGLGMEDPKGPYYDSVGRDNRCRRIILLLDKVTEETKLKLKSLFTPNNSLTIVDFSETKTILGYSLPPELWKPMKKSMETRKRSASRVKNSVNSKMQSSFKELQNPMTSSLETRSSDEKSITNEIETSKRPRSYANESIKTITVIENSANEHSESDDSAHSSAQIILIYPSTPARNAITINEQDCACLGQDKCLNDVIIDFYLKYLSLEVLSEDDKNRIYTFSSYFYKRLTHPYVSDVNKRLPLATKRYAGVQKWTKDVNIFEKDFIIIPINKSSHWFLAIICFPGLVGKVDVCRSTAGYGKVETRSNTENSMKIKLQRARTSTQEVRKSPCILVFDSLPGFVRHNKVIVTLRDYLRCEYFAKTGMKKIFSANTINGACPKVPQQSNCSDCGIYLLHYVERFFQDPIKDYNLPIKGLEEWFDESAVVHKRKEIYDLIMSRR
ncbi:uncharacterized protein LOC124405593 [Diprion similis]|uniref:uncharacterized protein LOC124405593 n=1 Tax=Diprion similis TaxID=362088 RepID=UPI001EF847E6|nr:uncharacterized protein LOC124405593 [Diprion similis]